MECWLCNGTGKFKDPNDKENFDRLFDMYDRPGTISMGECRERALKEVGYTIIPCSRCDKGKYFATLLENRKNTVELIKITSDLLISLEVIGMMEKLSEVKSMIETFNQIVKDTDNDLYNKFKYRVIS